MAIKEDTQAWARLKTVLQGALQEPPDSRGEFLDRACAGDDSLRREVESLLAALGESEGFLSRPAAEMGVPVAEGRRIGPYLVLNEIGRGGMAIVYRAVRDDDLFRKTVALKLLSAVGSETLLRRFFQERQILGRLQHPNVAAVFDGGATEEGQPYLVMELVDGRPITEYCEISRIGTKRRSPSVTTRSPSWLRATSASTQEVESNWMRRCTHGFRPNGADFDLANSAQLA